MPLRQLLEFQNSLALDETVEQAASLCGDELTSVYLDNTRISDRSLLALGSCSSLREISCGNTRVSNRGINGIKSLPQLELLFVNGSFIDDEISHVLPNFNSLVALDLSSTSISTATLASLQWIPNLQELHIDDTYLTYGNLGALALCDSLSTLSIRRLRGGEPDWSWVTKRGTLSSLSVSETALDCDAIEETLLIELDIERCSLTPKALSVIGLCTKLTSLRICNSRIEDSHLSLLSDLQCDNLDLSRNSISANGLQSVSLDRCWYLDLSATFIDDQCLDTISECPELQHLCIQQTDITDRAVDAFLAMNELRVLDVSSTAITARGLCRLASHPSLKCVKYSRPSRTSEVMEIMNAFQGEVVRFYPE